MIPPRPGGASGWLPRAVPGGRERGRAHTRPPPGSRLPRRRPRAEAAPPRSRLPRCAASRVPESPLRSRQGWADRERGGIPAPDRTHEAERPVPRGIPVEAARPVRAALPPSPAPRRPGSAWRATGRGEPGCRVRGERPRAPRPPPDSPGARRTPPRADGAIPDHRRPVGPHPGLRAPRRTPGVPGDGGPPPPPQRPVGRPRRRPHTKG